MSIKKIKYRMGRISSKEFVEDLRSKGIKIGEGTVFFNPSSVTIDVTRPYLLEIGKYTKITQGTIILTHDYSLSVLRRVYGEWLGEGKKTYIGDIVFIGMNSIILMGTHIGNNVIVGAGSVVRGNIPDNVVIAGNPAKVVCTLEEHYKKRKENTTSEAIECAKAFYERYNRVPTPKDLSGFKFLFTPRDEKILGEYDLNFECNGDDPDDVKKHFYATHPKWEDFDKFIDEALY